MIGAYIGVGGVPKKLKGCQVGVGGTPRKVKEIYLGVGGAARVVWKNLPDLFGTGADGDLYIAAGQTVTLPVATPHQSVVEKHYNNITIEAGGVLTTSAPNAGLVLRILGNCTIRGTISQAAKAPLTNPNNTYRYPAELSCGAGGNGGAGGVGRFPYNGAGGKAQAMRTYGGGYGAGGGGGEYYLQSSSTHPAGVGGSTNSLTIASTGLFQGGAMGGVGWGGSIPPGDGVNGGGGGGIGGRYSEGYGASGAGGTGGSGKGQWDNTGSGGGGAGNYGGGVTLIYCGGTLTISGSILCTGGNGGIGGIGSSFYDENTYGGSGGGGGGGGGGAIYLTYMEGYTNTGTLNVAGGAGGSAGVALGWELAIGKPGYAGANGTVTIKQYTEGMTV